jgi:sigma-B regulation protein RsbU (phosphoserine phosphatase)
LSLNLDYDKYFSVFFGIYNKNTHEFKYVNAGHNSVPVLIRDDSIKTLMLKGYPIANIFDNVDYTVEKVTLKVGDKILLYTDGITEATNSQGVQFGFDNLIQTLSAEGNILKNIKESLNNFSTDHKDDYAVLLAEII